MSLQMDHLSIIGKRSLEAKRAADCVGKSSAGVGEISSEKVEITNALQRPQGAGFLEG